jgi:hypothetical protein
VHNIQLHKLAERLDNILTRLDRIDERLDKVDDRLDKMDGTLEIGDDRLEKVEKRINTQVSFQAAANATRMYNDVLQFYDVALNIGGHYNPNNGVFLFTVNGVYLFNVVILSNRGKIVRFALKIDGVEIGRGYGQDRIIKMTLVLFPE